jgi:peptide/nickel transport system substrate-binding protein
MGKKKLIWLLVSSLIVLSLLLASCGGGEEETVTEEPVTEEPTEEPVTEEPVTPTEGGNWWDKWGEPQYGGTITYEYTGDVTSWDPYSPRTGYIAINMYANTLAEPDWKLDRDIWDFKINYVPMEYYDGALAESWEIPDWTTYIFHIRKNVYFHDKPPVNGRELTAYDVEYSFHRQLGLGSGFTEPSPSISSQYLGIDSVTATDKYTVVFNTKEPSIDTLDNLLQTNVQSHVVPHEAIEEWGDMEDWEHTIGTGPFMISSYVTSTSIEAVKHPNYFGYDERHPENRLPYADKLKILIIPDLSTALAALRTGKIDLMEGIDWEQAQSLAKTNPDLLQVTIPGMGVSLDLRNDKEPFTDIKVKKAMQMAIDRETIAETIYGGFVDGTPYCLAGPSLKGFYTPFDEWPQELKDEYTYNPEGAKKLLAEAGFPDGFKTNVIASSGQNTDLLQILKAYFLDIGIDMEIKLMERTAFNAVKSQGTQDQMVTGECALPWPPNRFLARGYSKQRTNWTFNNDPVYDEMFEKFSTTLDDAERKNLIREMDMYATTKHWRIVVLPTVSFNIYQPWFKGYSGENQTPGMGGWGYVTSRVWIDQELKKSMGY